MFRIGIVAAVALAGTSLAASGCGKSAKTLTRNELIAQADTICRRVNDKIKALAHTASESYEDLVVEVGSYEQTTAAKLGTLVPPAAMANDWKKIVADYRTIGQYTVQYGEDLKSHNTRAGRLVFRAGSTIVKPMTATARNDGFKDCDTVG